MKSIARSIALLVLALLTACAVPTTAPARELLMNDPLLGLSFDPHIFRFEQFPYRRSIADLAQSKTQWIFASYRDAKTQDTYWIVSGFHEVEPDDNGVGVKAQSEPDFGAVVQRSYGHWKILGVPDRLFDKDQPLLTTEILDGLMRDATSRYVSAFTGVSNLSQLIEDQHIDANDVPRSLTDQLIKRGVRIAVKNAR